MDENQMFRGVSTGFARPRKLRPFFAPAVFVGQRPQSRIRRKRARRGQDAPEANGSSRTFSCSHSCSHLAENKKGTWNLLLYRSGRQSRPFDFDRLTRRRCCAARISAWHHKPFFETSEGTSCGRAPDPRNRSSNGGSRLLAHNRSLDIASSKKHLGAR